MAYASSSPEFHNCIRKDGHINVFIVKVKIKI